jgi:hypothetical protein
LVLFLTSKYRPIKRKRIVKLINNDNPKNPPLYLSKVIKPG